MDNAKVLIAWNLNDGTIHRFRSHITILATGGYGKVYYTATSAHTCTGDGNGMALEQDCHYRTWNSFNFIQQEFME